MARSTRPRPTQLTRHGRHLDFVARYVHRESEKRSQQQDAPLTAKQRAALRKQLKNKKFLKPDYADSTKINIVGILRKWKRYVDAAALGDWKSAAENADRETAMDFLYFLCEQYKITSWGTSWEYFRQFKQLHSSVTGRFMDRNDCREVLKWHDTVIVPKFKLRAPNIYGKPVLGSDDLLALLAFNIGYDDGIFPLERQRVQLSAIYLILAYTGARPAEVVGNERKKPTDGSMEEVFGFENPRHENNDDEDEDTDLVIDEDSRLLEEMLCQETIGRGRPKALCYEDVTLLVIRHPETKRDVLAMKIKFIHHKGADRKPKPTIFFFTQQRRLLFCLVTAIVSLAVVDGAFAAPSLTSPERVFGVKNRGPVLSTPLRWKKEWLKRPIFRRFEDTSTSDAVLPYYKFRDDMKRQTLDAGFEKSLGPRSFRRGTANAMNGKAADAVRDQALRHDPGFHTFNNAYINERVQFDVQNAFLDEPAEDGILKMFTHVSIMRDPRASQDMVPDEVWQSLPLDPEIVRLEEQRAKLKRGVYRVKGHPHEHQIRELTKTIATKRTQRLRDVRYAYREDYFHNRPTWDIEMQAIGEVGEDYIEPLLDLEIAERLDLAEAMCNQPMNLDCEQLNAHRVLVATLMVSLCHKRETERRDRIRQRASDELLVKAEQAEADDFPLLMQKTQCPSCIGDTRLPLEERTFQYARPAVMNNHFERAHLKTLREMGQENLIFCDHPKCKEDGVKLTSLDHFKNHVQTEQGVWLRP